MRYLTLAEALDLDIPNAISSAREALIRHESASRLNAPRYRRWASATTFLSLSVRRRSRTGEITITSPSVETSSGVEASIRN